MQRRLLGAMAVAALATVWAETPVTAQGFPAKPITLIVPWPPGGGSDTVMRLIAEPMGKALGQTIVVVNKPGAGGQIGLRETAEAAADGYTISFIATGFIAQQYNLDKANAIDDFAYIAWVGVDASGITTNTKTGWKTLAEFIKAAKDKPGSIRNGNDQPGGTSFLGVALVERTLGVKLVRVPYAGDAPNVQGLLSGEVQTSTAAITNMIDHHKAGTLKVLAVTGAKREAKLPDVPNLKELGHDLVSGTMRAIVAPKQTPADVKARLEKAALTALDDEGFRKRAIELSFGLDPAGGEEALKRTKALDAQLYPILLEAEMVKFRKR